MEMKYTRTRMQGKLRIRSCRLPGRAVIENRKDLNVTDAVQVAPANIERCKAS
jgi:hypothetical protein